MPSSAPLGHCRLGVIFVHHGDVVENIFAIFVHAAHAVLDDGDDFIAERRIVGDAIRHGAGEYMAVAVFVLQTFAGERGAARCRAEQKSARAGIARGPEQIADALEAKYRIENIEWNHRHAVRRIAHGGSEPGRNRTGFGDAFF